MKPSRFFILLLILLAGLIPVSVYFLESETASFSQNLASLPTRGMIPSEQFAQVLAGLIVKPTYMMLSLLIILALTGQAGADLAALRWGQIAFLVGEIFCAINFYVYRHESILSEYLHSYGMALAFGLTTYALLEGLDARLMRLTASKSACEALALCGQCTRHASTGCKARAFARFSIPFLAILAFIPLLSPLQPDAYAVSIFGFPYSYARLDVYEMYERRILPALALAAFFLAYLPLWKRQGEPPIPFAARALICAGIGALGFSIFRVALSAIFAGNLVWFEFWEETTELMFVGAVGFVLWQFRAALWKNANLFNSLQ